VIPGDSALSAADPVRAAATSRLGADLVAADPGMYVVLPKKAAPASDADQWDAVRAALAEAPRTTEVDLSMPRWSFDSTIGLVPTLRREGLTVPFLGDGQLDGIFPGAVVASAVHGATITVAEKGTVAAGVTELMLAGGGDPRHPRSVSCWTTPSTSRSSRTPTSSSCSPGTWRTRASAPADRGSWTFERAGCEGRGARDGVPPPGGGPSAPGALMR